MTDKSNTMFGKEIRFFSTVSKMGKRKIISIPEKYDKRNIYEEIDKMKPEHIRVIIQPIVDDDGKPI